MNLLSFCAFLLIIALSEAEVNLSCNDRVEADVPNLNISLFISFDKPNKNYECGLSKGMDDFPFHAAIYSGEFVGMTHQCAGALISKDFVLTSAACLDENTNPRKPNTIIIQLGRKNFLSIDEYVQSFFAKEIIYHPNYIKKNYISDVALLRLSKPASINDHVRPICLWDNYLIPTTEVLVSGFDYDSAVYTGEELHSITMKLVSMKECQKNEMEIEQGSSLVCATFLKKSICLGDDGAPVVIRNDNKWKLIGINSLSIGYQTEVICDPNHFSAFTKVYDVYKWVKEYL